MISIPGPVLPSWPLVIVMLVISLLLIFAGRKVVKVLAFLVVGLVGATIGGTLGAQYLTSIGSAGTLLGALIGFFAGGLIGLLLVHVGIGLAVGYGAYVLTLDIVSSTTAALVAGIVFFIVGLVFYNKILTLITAVAGGLLLYYALRLYGLDPTVSTALAALVTLVGIWVSYRPGRRAGRLPANTAPTS
jgi:hypothetical protein